MDEEFDEDFVNDAQRLIESSDLSLMSLSMGANENAGDNYKMAVSLQLKNVLISLDKNLRKSNIASKITSWIMIVLTIVIVLLTAVLVWKGL